MLSELILFTILFYIIICLFGITIGSFLNVCIYRIPKKENIATTRSHCMECNTQLKWYDLVPLFSWLFLRGKCRYCKAKISVQYPLVELANGIGYVWIFWVNGFNFISILYCLCFSAMLALSVIDLRTFEIPVGFNIFILVLGIARVIYDFEHVWTYVIGFFCVSGFLFILYLLTAGRGIGGGDIKLMAVAGLLIGWQNIIVALCVGCVLGSIIHVTLMVVLKKERMLAFGPYLSLGIFLAMLYGKTLFDWYVSLIVG
ncbi:MAG: prepilin peptidase [Lachnospiraceae bacterium]|nr:prepilin peptidase [Lachnospiraceae bacterium]